MRASLAATAAFAVGAAVIVLAPAGHSAVAASERAIGGPPPMGWSSWSYLRRHPTAASVEAQALALKTSGLAAVGYRSVNLDDYWMACNSTGPEVDSYGRWIPYTAAFPAGIAAVARRVHADGLRFGLYVTPGIPENAVLMDTSIKGTAYRADQIARPGVAEANYNCAHMDAINYSAPGAQRYIDSWADEFAAWGVDYVKLDGVGAGDIPDIDAWSVALRQTGRPMLLELSSALPLSDAPLWASLADEWRTTGDIECHSCEAGDSSYPLTDWANVAIRFDAVAGWQPFGGPAGWNDEDSLELGNGAADGLTLPERQTMMSLWSLAGAPLILGADLTRLDSADKAILANRAVIALDQDGIAARRIIDVVDEQVFAKRAPDGDWYIGIFNTDPSAAHTLSVWLPHLGLRGAMTVSDVWTGRRLGIVTSTYTAAIAPGGVSLISVQPISGPAPGPGWLLAAGLGPAA
jgi:alpha-galactosidase